MSDRSGSDRRLDEAIRALPRELPPDDLWPSLAGRLRPRRRPWGRVLPLCALAAAAAILGVLAWPGDEPRATASSAIADRTPAVTPTNPLELIPEEQRLREAVRQLAGAYAERRAVLDRELLAVYDDNLGIVDSAIARSRAALRDAPDDAHLQRVLAGAYRHKLTLLQRAVGALPPREDWP